jgi:hypothetical protein
MVEKIGEQHEIVSLPEVLTKRIAGECPITVLDTRPMRKILRDGKTLAQSSATISACAHRLAISTPNSP